MSELEKFKQRILSNTHLLLVREYGFTRSQATQMIKDSKLEESIERKPLLFAHMTPDQVLDCIFD